MAQSQRGSSVLPAIGHVHSGCLHCAGKPAIADLDWRPHPGFGMLDLLCDGEVADGWQDFKYWPTEDEYVPGHTFQMRDFKGDGLIDVECPASYERWSLDERVTLREIEEVCAADPDHDWRLRVEGPLYGAVYQRHSPGVWVAVERLDGFA